MPSLPAMTKENVARFLANNRVWASAIREDDPELFTRLSKGQTPSLLYIGCSDSRVTAEEMMGLGPGEVFVLRNIANMVSALDPGAMAAIGFGVTHLQVSDIVVCGHYYCGGIAAALQPRDLGVLNPWLRTIRDVYRLHSRELDGIEDPELRLRRFVELNVREQCINVLKSAEVQRAYRAGTLDIHCWIFDISTGLLAPTDLDIDAEMNRLMDIYRLD